jgi:hypothetical protein
MSVEEPTISEVAEWAEEVEQVHARIGLRFARAEPRRRVLAYLRGLLSLVERKVLPSDAVGNSMAVPLRAHAGCQPETQATTEAPADLAPPVVPGRGGPVGRGWEFANEPCDHLLTWC